MRYHRHAEPLSFGALTTTSKLMGGPGLLMGWGLLETTGAAAATIEIWDGGDTTGQLIVPIALSSAQSTRDWNSPDGILFSRGLFLNVLAGSVRGVLWVRLRDVGRVEAVA
jgi:hypothetical protein